MVVAPSILLALYLIYSPAIAFAECAWILWHEHTFFSPKEGHTHNWETPTAYSTKEDCEAIKEGTFRILLAQAETGAGRGTDTIITKVPSVWISSKTPLNNGDFLDWQQKLTCLPDTVNPK